MSATLGFQSEVMRHLFLNEAISDIGSGLPASVTGGYLYVCLLTAAPGEAGDLTNEAQYGGYARIPLERGVDWSELDGYVANAAVATFPECVSGSENITHFGICKTLTGDDMIYYGEFDNTFPVSAEVQPSYDIGQLAIELD